MKVTPDTAGDFEKYYSGTYIVVPEAEPNEVGLVKGISNTVAYLEYDGYQEAKLIYDKVGYEVKSPLTLSKQYFLMDDKSVAFIQRVPARMWKKGISTKNTQISRPDGCAVMLGFNSLNAFLQNKDKVSTFEEVSANKQGVIDKNWCVYAGSVFLKGYAVGKFNERKQTLLIGRDFLPFFPQKKINDWRILSV